MNQELQLKTFAEESSHSTIYLWTLVTNLYRDDVESWNGSLEMLNLVEYLSKQQYALEFFPNRSLGNLCIKSEYSFSHNSDTLVISWNEQQKSFQLFYYEAKNSKPDKRMCKKSEVRDIVLLKLLRMKLAYHEN